MNDLKSYNKLSVAALGGIDSVPDLAVLMSSEAPTAPCTVTSPSGRQSSNSSSAFTQSGENKQLHLESLYFIPDNTGAHHYPSLLDSAVLIYMVTYTVK